VAYFVLGYAIYYLVGQNKYKDGLIKEEREKREELIVASVKVSQSVLDAIGRIEVGLRYEKD